MADGKLASLALPQAGREQIRRSPAPSACQGVAATTRVRSVSGEAEEEGRGGERRGRWVDIAGWGG